MKLVYHFDKVCLSRKTHLIGHCIVEAIQEKIQCPCPIWESSVIKVCIHTKKISFLKSGVEFDMNDILYEFKNLHH